ncbi:phosphate ABC transporter, permease protein PstA [Aliidiomarina taiwanensis]|uniref:Phosphate transport system permease protein PstA n=1 Tax=Aliidiomarina taiwanensis TaxID=946228 RepID=A0A432X1G2_9GAMM|nr:phosphate ABC transporter permease PstA [Aliidiomarina taiwanensis]RUO40129.1 phosphate ABC transporter, permease protein PstA [Aliidiomarina taiwanensis]
MKHWFKSGSPWIWLTAGAVSLSVIMIVGLLGLIAVRGFSHFWPAPVAQIAIHDPRNQVEETLLGEIARSETVTATLAREAGHVVPENLSVVTRYLIKQGNREQVSSDFVWRFDLGMAPFTYPKGVYAIERRTWGDFYGFPVALQLEQQHWQATDADFAKALNDLLEQSHQRHQAITRIERQDIGKINSQMNALRLQQRQLELDGVKGRALLEAKQGIAQQEQALQAEYAELRTQLDQLYSEQEKAQLRMRMMNGKEVAIALADIVAITMPNDMTLGQKWAEYFKQVGGFLSKEPREANTEGGIFPAIFGTITMVFIMSIMVTPFGVLAAIYLREYAKQGVVTRLVRISVYNLAGVPSIVYGVFGLGFFIYFLGGNIDRIFYEAALPSPTFGTPGLFWASLTLALLTLPVVIVSTEEGLARIPSTIRQGSLALGATKSETLWRVVVPLATPGMMTGLILAIARAAGEVAPLMLVGVVKLAPTLPVDGEFPFVHLERKIMHLGFHIFDVGFQSPNVEAARPLVYATALTLVTLIVVLNITAISIRNRLREKYRNDSD